MNSVQLVGNLTRDPELRQLPSGTATCQLRVAVNGRRRTGDNDWEEIPNFFDVVAYGRLAETCAEHLARGRRVGVTGRLQSREWETDAGKRSVVEVVAAEIDFLANRSDAPAANTEPDPVTGEPALA